MSNTDNVSNNNETITNDEKKKNKLVIPLITLAIFLSIIGVFGLYIHLSSKPEKIVTSLINTLYDTYYNKTNNTYKINLNEKPYLMEGNLNITTDIPYLEELQQEKINYKIGIDSNNKKMITELSLIENENKLINLIYYFLNNESYLKFDEYEKLIKLNNDTVNFEANLTFNDENLNINNEDLNYIIKEFKDILINSIDMDAFKKESDEIKINDKNKKINKYSFKINEENLKKLENNLSKNISKNKNLVKKLSEITNKSEDEIKNSLNETNNNYQNLGEFNIYTSKFTNNLEMIEYSYLGNKIQIIFDEEIKNIIITSGLYSIKFDIINYTKDKIHIDFTINYGVPIKGYIKTEIKKLDDNEFNYSTTININYLNYNLGLKNETNLKEAENDLFNIDLTNIVDENSVDQNEISKIMENFLLRYQNSNLFKLIQNLTETEENEVM